LARIDISRHIVQVGRGEWGGLAPLSGRLDANAYLVRDGSHAALIDCGFGPGYAALAANVQDAGVDPDAIETLALTHLHYDHSGAAAAWQNAYGVAVACHAKGAESLASNDLRLVGAAINLGPVEYTPPRIDRQLNDGDEIRVGEIILQVLHTPGHVPDLICLRGQIDGTDTLFSTDCAIGNQGDVEGCIGWLDGCWRSNIYDYASTLDRLLIDPPESLLPGHGTPIVGRHDVAASLRACRRRLQRVIDIPDVGSMLPLTGADPSYED